MFAKVIFKVAGVLLDIMVSFCWQKLTRFRTWAFREQKIFREIVFLKWFWLRKCPGLAAKLWSIVSFIQAYFQVSISKTDWCLLNTVIYLITHVFKTSVPSNISQVTFGYSDLPTNSRKGHEILLKPWTLRSGLWLLHLCSASFSLQRGRRVRQVI